jgi:ribosomal protein S15P/S13E
MEKKPEERKAKLKAELQQLKNQRKTLKEDMKILKKKIKMLKDHGLSQPRDQDDGNNDSEDHEKN